MKMSKIIDKQHEKEYEIHPLCMLFPWMDETTRASVSTDMGKHGQRDSIKLFEGKVLDGKNRLRICVDLGLEPIIEVLPDDTDPIAYVKSEGLCRRDLTPWQRYEISKRLSEYNRSQLPEEEQEKIKEAIKDPIKKKVIEEQEIKQLAREVKSTPDTIKKAKEIEEKVEVILKEDPKDTAEPEIIEKERKVAKRVIKELESNAITIDKAHKEIKNLHKIRTNPLQIPTQPTKQELKERIKALELENRQLITLNNKIIRFVKHGNEWENFKQAFGIVEFTPSDEPTPKELREAGLL